MTQKQSDILVNNVQLDEESFEFLFEILNRVKIRGSEADLFLKVVNAVKEAKMFCLCPDCNEAEDPNEADEQESK